MAAEVWILPPDSVTGTRWTRWPPASNFRRDQAPSPSTIKLISLKPPSSVSLELATSTRQPFRSAYMEYMRKRSAAKSMPSSPPTPPRISMMTFLPSLGSFGRSRSLISPSRRSRAAFAARNSSSSPSSVAASMSSPAASQAR